MRRALRDQWPAIAERFGIRPWELDLLTFGELDALTRHEAERKQQAEIAEWKRSLKGG